MIWWSFNNTAIFTISGDVCFEALDTGSCQQNEETRNLTRYYFNSRSNKCEPFIFKGCQGNHNNFHTENMCNIVCPGTAVWSFKNSTYTLLL